MHLPVLTQDGYAAMPLRVKAFEAPRKQHNRGFVSKERLGGGGSTSICKKSASGRFLRGARQQRPVLSPRKPGAGFDMSQGCAGESAGIAGRH